MDFKNVSCFHSFLFVRTLPRATDSINLSLNEFPTAATHLAKKLLILSEIPVNTTKIYTAAVRILPFATKEPFPLCSIHKIIRSFILTETSLYITYELHISRIL